MTIAEGNVGAAIGLVFAAGAATAVGASVVFFPGLVKCVTRRFLAGSLGFSAGVMIYLSFVEIFFKAVTGFNDAGFSESISFLYSTLSFFGGVLIMKLINMSVKHLSGDNSPHRRDVDEDIQIVWNEDEGQLNIAGDSEVEEIIAHHCVGHAKDPVGELEEWHRRAEQELHPHESTVGDTNKDISADEDEDSRDSSKSSTHADVETGGALRSSQAVEADEPLMASDGAEPVLVVVENIPNVSDNNGLFRAPFMNNMSPKEEKKRLVKMGLSTTLAIILHNFPEGLATFVAALDDPPVGAALAIAIAIHNIPEGLCVALPIYYATGDRWKAFMWGCISGIAEPIAAILGWIVLASIMTDEVYAILFGLVSGMMIMISMKELIPTAHRYDPEDTVVTHTIISGMAVIALSLVLFTI